MGPENEWPNEWVRVRGACLINELDVLLRELIIGLNSVTSKPTTIISIINNDLRWPLKDHPDINNNDNNKKINNIRE